MIYREFAARIRYVMTLKGLQNKDIVAGFKEHYGYTIQSSTVSQYLNGRFAPTEERAEMMAKVLGVDATWLRGYGSVDDVNNCLNEEEQQNALKHMRKIFTSLRPTLQRMVIEFFEYMEFVNQIDDIMYQQNMSKLKKEKEKWKHVISPSVSVFKSKKG